MKNQIILFLFSCKKKIQSSIIFFIMIFTNSYAISFDLIPSVPYIDSKAYILMDYFSGKILAEKNADKQHIPASLTKIMTSYIIGQTIKSGKISINDIVTISNNAWAIGNPIFKGSSLMFLKPGDNVSVSDLIRGIDLQSGNDACVAMAEYIAGDENNFIKLMNDTVNHLGLKNTHFLTVHGLDAKGQYSSARDMALISQALIHDVPEEYAIYKEKEFCFNNIRQLNRNNLLWDKNLNVDGIKTGHTIAAGYNLVTSATNNNSRLISVVLGARNSKIRDIESKKLLNWGFRFFETIKLLDADKPFISQPVWFSNVEKVNLGIQKDLYITIPKGKLKFLKISYNLYKDELHAPLLKNEIMGVINIHLDNQIIAKQPLIVLQNINEGNIFRNILDYIELFFQRWFN